MSVLILTHNKARFTSRCLQSVLATDYDSVELWLVDNGSEDNTPAVLDEAQDLADSRGWGTHRIRFNENVGAVAGRNAALQQMADCHVLFLDNDVVLEDPHWLSRLVAVAESDSSIGAVGAKLVFPRPKGVIQCAGCAVTPRGRVVFLGRGERADAAAFNQEREVQCIISACALFTRAAVDAAGQLDMAFHPVQFEDIDYCYRIREKGFRVIYTPEVEALHYENVTTDGSAGFNYRYLTVKNGLVFKKRWRHVYADEDGPDDAAVVWSEIPHVAWHEVEDPTNDA